MFHKTEAEKLFFEDVREKKKAASGVHHKTGKNGYTGTLRFPSDIMSRKDKYNYRKAGKVMTTNLFDEILTVDEFEALETYERKNRLAYWRSQFQNKKIMQEMGISNKRYYDIVAELELPKAPRVNNGAPKKPRKAYTRTAPVANTPAAAIAENEIKEPVQEIIIDGLHLVYNGTFSAEQLQKSLSKFIALLEGETDEFFIELKLMQKQPSK
jgi:replicative superfamily II helicase